MRVDALQVADEIEVQRAGLDAGGGVDLQAAEVGGCVLVLQLAEPRLLLEQLLCIAHMAVEEHAHAQAQVRQQALVQVRDLGHAGVREAALLADLLVLHVLQHALDDVADLLHVDRERDDLGPALALLLRQRGARDLRQVELDGGVERVDHFLHLAQVGGQVEVVVADHRQHAAQHGLDRIGLAQRLAGGAAQRDRRRAERELVEVARGAVVGAGRHLEPTLQRGGQQTGEGHEQDRLRGVERQVEQHHLHQHHADAVLQPDMRQPQERRDQHHRQTLEQQVAERQATGGDIGAPDRQHRHHRAPDVGAQHQAEGGQHRHQALIGQRGHQQHDGQARIADHGQEGADQQLHRQVVGQRDEQRAHQRRLHQRPGVGDDQLQRQRDQAQADRDLADPAGAGLFARHVGDHAHEDQQRRQPRQVEGIDQRHHAGADIGAQHHHQRRRGGHQATADERRHDQRGGGARLHQAGHAQARQHRLGPGAHAGGKHAAQVLAEQAQHAGAHDLGRPHQQGDGGQEIEQMEHQISIQAPRADRRQTERLHPRSTAAVGAVAPGAHQQRHVIVSRRIGHAEIQRHLIEEHGRRQHQALGGKVGADGKHQPISPGAQCRAFEQRPADAAVVIERDGLQAGAAAVRTDRPQGDLHAGGRAAVGGVEYVSGQLSHRVASKKLAGWIKVYTL